MLIQYEFSLYSVHAACPKQNDVMFKKNTNAGLFILSALPSTAIRCNATVLKIAVYNFSVCFKLMHLKMNFVFFMCRFK